MALQSRSAVNQEHGERGVALIIVIFIVALASIIVINLAYSTDMAGRINAMTERSLQAEYLLKSATSVARVLIKEDTSAEDGPQDIWAKFSEGQPVPPEVLGINEPNLRAYLEIRPEDAKMRVNQILPNSTGQPDQRWRGVFVRLFRSLGFDDDQKEVDTWGPRIGEHTDAEGLVGRLIDYMDADTESYSPGGIESELPSDQPFPNKGITRLSELSQIPGFTPNRVRRLTPFMTAYGAGRVNINFAPALVIQALSEGITEDMAQRIISFRESEEGPFQFSTLKQSMTDIVGDEVYENQSQTGISSLITPGSDQTYYQVLAKVDYGTATFFMRSILRRQGTGNLPILHSVELF